MFDQTFVDAQAQTRKPWTVLTSLTLQCGLVAALLIAPLMHVARLDVLPRIEPLLHVDRIELRTQPAIKPVAARSESTMRVPAVFKPPAITVPSRVPARIDMTPDAPTLPVTQDASTSGAPNSFIGLLPDLPSQPPRERARPQPAAPPSVPVHIGGSVLAAKLISAPKPVYPRTALITRTQGSVVLRAIIARDGTISNLQLLSGPPLLVQAAIEAVRQWRYRPTQLNGSPVEVITEITVNFTLAQ